MKRSLMMAICLAWLMSLSAYGQWWKDNFIIGTFYDPPANNDSDVVRHYNMAVNAGFNLFTGQLMKHSNHAEYTVRDTYFQSIKNNSVRPFFFSRKGSAFNDSYDGLYVKDEPRYGDSSDYASIINSIQSNNTNNTKLGFINLLPAYEDAFNKWNPNYTTYLNEYYDSSIIDLKVLCFDNYYADSSFPQYDNKNIKRRYYSNLAEMRNRAGNRPLWSYVLTSERIFDFTPSRQRAYLRLSAFAPMAYGAKGILYYYYDQRDHYAVIRDTYYRDHNGWDSSVYYALPDSVKAYDVLFGHFNPDGGSLAHADIGVKTDEQRGKWYMKYASDESLLDNRQWDYENEWYGTSNIACHFVTLWNDRLDHLATIRNDGKLLLAQSNKIWTDSASLSGINRSNFSLLNRKKIAGGKIMGNSQPDLAVGIGDTVRIYRDYSKQGGFAGIEADSIFTNLRQLVTVRNTSGTDSLFALSMSSNSSGMLSAYNAYNSDTSKWNNKSISVSHPQAGTPDHFWLEQYSDRTEVHMQNTEGKLFYGTVGSNSVNISKYNGSNSYKYYKEYHGERNDSCTYDLYCFPDRSNLKIGLVNSFQEPTPLFGMADTINHYLREQVADVVMNCEWVKCFHHNNYHNSDEQVKIVDVISKNAIISNLNDTSLMVGVFKENGNYRYLIVVNKGYYTITNAKVTIKGNYSQATLKPRIDTEATTCTAIYKSYDNTTDIRWPNMTAGECVIVDLTPPTNKSR